MKKSLGKVGQWTGEKLGKYEVTREESEFLELEKKTDATDETIKRLINKTEEYLQPNPVIRSKLRMLQVANKPEKLYPQPEGELAEAMLKGAVTLGDSKLGNSLGSLAEAEKQVAEARTALDARVMQSFVQPLGDFHSREVKEVMHNRNRLEKKRLDYDLKRRAKEKKPNDAKCDDEFQLASNKYNDVKETVYTEMHSLLANDEELVSQLVNFAEAQAEYHQAALAIMREAVDKLRSIQGTGSAHQHSQGMSPPHPTGYLAGGRAAVALYDFDAANDGELSFKQGNQIEHCTQIDASWIEGVYNGKKGIFPSNYVKFL